MPESSEQEFGRDVNVDNELFLIRLQECTLSFASGNSKWPFSEEIFERGGSVSVLFVLLVGLYLSREPFLALLKPINHPGSY